MIKIKAEKKIVYHSSHSFAQEVLLFTESFSKKYQKVIDIMRKWSVKLKSAFIFVTLTNHYGLYG